MNDEQKAEFCKQAMYDLRRIITNPNNKTRLCSKCQKTGSNIFGAVSLIVLGKKFGLEIIKGAIKIIKR